MLSRNLAAMPGLLCRIITHPRTNNDLKLRNHPGFKGVWNYCKWCSRKQIKASEATDFPSQCSKNHRASHPCRTVGSWLSSGAKWIRRDPVGPSMGQRGLTPLSVLPDHGTERKGPLGAQEESYHWGWSGRLEITLSARSHWVWATATMIAASH